MKVHSILITLIHKTSPDSGTSLRRVPWFLWLLLLELERRHRLYRWCLHLNSNLKRRVKNDDQAIVVYVFAEVLYFITSGSSPGHKRIFCLFLGHRTLLRDRKMWCFCQM